MANFLKKIREKRTYIYEIFVGNVKYRLILFPKRICEWPAILNNISIFYFSFNVSYLCFIFFPLVAFSTCPRYMEHFSCYWSWRFCYPCLCTGLESIDEYREYTFIIYLGFEVLWISYTFLVCSSIYTAEANLTRLLSDPNENFL